jgi:hypothetical protein
MLIRLAALTFVVFATATCPRSDPMTPEPTPETLAPVPGQEEPIEAPEEDPFAPTFERVTREARYRISPVAGGKRLQAVSLDFDDGEAWIRAYRPLRSELRFAEKRVVVTGRPYWPSSNVQAVIDTHFELESIELAPGETPWDPVPTLIPPPPFARTAAQATARTARHVQCRGVAKEGVFEFPDGSTLPLAPFGGFFEVERIDGDQTLLAWVATDGTLHARGACAGEVPRCGMTDDNMRD